MEQKLQDVLMMKLAIMILMQLQKMVAVSIQVMREQNLKISVLVKGIHLTVPDWCAVILVMSKMMTVESAEIWTMMNGIVPAPGAWMKMH